MKFSILSGAYKNAGDFLILERSKKLLQYIFPSAEFDIYKRNIKLDKYIDNINNTSAIVIAGGPFYQKEFYPNNMPLIEDLNKIKVPIYTLGGGIRWKKDYCLDDNTKVFFKYIEKYGSLSCRENNTIEYLKNNGIFDTVMTGCPALYNIDFLSNIKFNFIASIKNICISDCGNIIYLPMYVKLINYLKNRYKDANIKFIFQRGIIADEYTTKFNSKIYIKYKKIIENLGIKTYDISYGIDGFKVYDDCDLHIGMRVHSHIYNISKGTPSILIEEDIRGNGINDILGLPHILSYNSKRTFIFFKYLFKVVKKMGNVEFYNSEINPSFIDEIDSVLSMYEKAKFVNFEESIEKIKCYYDIMKGYIKSWNLKY